MRGGRHVGEVELGDPADVVEDAGEIGGQRLELVRLQRDVREGGGMAHVFRGQAHPRSLVTTPSRIAQAAASEPLQKLPTAAVQSGPGPDCTRQGPQTLHADARLHPREASPSRPCNWGLAPIARAIGAWPQLHARDVQLAYADAFAACSVFESSIAIVIGPMPPGTGVIALATSLTGP